MILFFIVLISILLSLCSAVLDLDCVGNGYTDLLACNNYMQVYLQAFTGNGNGDIPQGYSKIQFPYNLTANINDINEVELHPSAFYMRLVINSVSNVDIVAGTMSLNVALGLEWTDRRLQWNTSKTLGI